MKWGYFKKIASDAKATVDSFAEYHKLLREGNVLRLEAVFSTESFNEMQFLLNKVQKRPSLKSVLAKEGCIIQISLWTEYVDRCIGDSRQVIEEAMMNYMSTGIDKFDEESIIQLHTAETMFRYFCAPKRCKRFDYRHAKDLIREGRIKIYR